jgi:D-hydroxyproline dehydrogenase subunit beta
MVAGGYARSVDRRGPDAVDRRPRTADVVVLGGGIIGCAAAAILADRGAEVVLVEADTIGAGASGRNLGAIQHPFDPVLAPLYYESLTRYRALAAEHADFAIGRDPAGLLLLNRDPDAAATQTRLLAGAVPELRPAFVDAAALRDLEPALGADLSAVLLDTGYPVRPASATDAWADIAAARGVEMLIGSAATPVLEGDRVAGAQLADGWAIAAETVLVTSGPWTPAVADPSGAWRPIAATWGVTLQLRLAGPAPRHIVEEDEIDAINRSAAATERAARAIDYGEPEPPSLFSLATAGGVSTLGSTFLPVEPDPTRIEPLLLHRAEPFLPGIARAQIVGRRVCARPQSVDGRPFIGPMANADGLFVCAGHGPWGISIGPATAALAARAILDGTAVPAELDARRPLTQDSAAS